MQKLMIDFSLSLKVKSSKTVITNKNTLNEKFLS